MTLYLTNVEGELLRTIPDFVHIKKIPELDEVLNGKFKNRFRWVVQNKGVVTAVRFLVAAICHKYSYNRGRYY